MDFPPLDVGTGGELKRFYQDFGPAVALVESGHHGPLDERGVPLVRYPEGVLAFNPITAAQYALGLHTLVLQGDAARQDRLRVVLDRLVEAQTDAGPRTGFWELRFQNPKYPSLRNPWVSALAQGNAISALLRGWQLFGDDGYRRAAEAGNRALHGQGAGSPPPCLESDTALWYEEYPHGRPLHVLNGHVYALLGVLDHARDSGDPESERRWRAAAATTLGALPGYDTGYWSRYDLRSGELVDRHYHRNIHIPQLRILAALTGDEGFEHMADRWEGYLNSPLCHLRRNVTMRTAGLRKRVAGRLGGGEVS